MIDLIYFDKKERNNYSLGSGQIYLNGLSRLNIFSGTNNSGKSMFLRSLVSNKEGILQFSEESLKNPYFEQFISKLTSNLHLHTNSYRYNFKNEKEFVNRKLLDISNSNKTNELDALIKAIQLQTVSVSYQDECSLLKTEKIDEIERLALEYTVDLSRLIVKSRKVYIPSLRGLRPVDYEVNSNQFSNKDLYNVRTKSDYFSEKDNVKIETGLNIYESIKKLLLGTTEDRKLISQFEGFLKEYVFDVDVTLIPKYDQDVLNIKLGDDDQLPIYNLGDGLQSIITILFPVFIRKDLDSEFFIEEPETHLHPHWQQKLLTAMLAISNAQYFVSSHSPVFINNDEAAIFAFDKDNEGIFNIDQVKDKGSAEALLKNLGYKPSDLLLSNFNVWVEGPSDKLYFKRIISLLDDNLIEGKDYSVLILGGENYRDWFEVLDDNNSNSFQALNKNFIVILDSDKNSSGSELSEYKQKLVDDLSKNSIWITEKREIENYIVSDVLKKSAKSILNEEKVVIKFGDYSDVTSVQIINNQVDYNSNIRLDAKMMRTVKENEGKINSVKATELKKLINSQLKTEKKTKLKKVKLAKYITMHFELEAYDQELISKVQEIVERIKEL